MEPNDRRLQELEARVAELESIVRRDRVLLRDDRGRPTIEIGSTSGKVGSHEHSGFVRFFDESGAPKIELRGYLGRGRAISIYCDHRELGAIGANDHGGWIGILNAAGEGAVEMTVAPSGNGVLIVRRGEHWGVTVSCSEHGGYLAVAQGEVSPTVAGIGVTADGPQLFVGTPDSPGSIRIAPNPSEGWNGKQLSSDASAKHVAVTDSDGRWPLRKGG